MSHILPPEIWLIICSVLRRTGEADGLVALSLVSKNLGTVVHPFLLEDLMLRGENEPTYRKLILRIPSRQRQHVFRRMRRLTWSLGDGDDGWWVSRFMTLLGQARVGITSLQIRGDGLFGWSPGLLEELSELPDAVQGLFHKTKYATRVVYLSAFVIVS